MPSTKTRIDWQPGPAAQEALAQAALLFPGVSRQAVIDQLVLTGLWAYKMKPWQPPNFVGSRYRWPLPERASREK